MATGLAPSSVSGTAHLKTHEVRSVRSSSFVKTSVTIQRKLNHQKTSSNFAIRAEYKDQRRAGGSEFIAGFLLGGAIFGTLGYVFAPQIRRSLLNEDESGFRRAKRPIYYDEGLEKTRQTLSEKIGQLNSAIDNVSSRLRGKDNMPQVPMESTDPEEATM
nr:uncharacterized protein LOC109194016 isoform X1 [Ipomoea trifida]